MSTTENKAIQAQVTEAIGILYDQAMKWDRERWCNITLRQIEPLKTIVSLLDVKELNELACHRRAQGAKTRKERTAKLEAQLASYAEGTIRCLTELAEMEDDQ